MLAQAKPQVKPQVKVAQFSSRRWLAFDGASTYVLTVVGQGRISCDCPIGAHGLVCKHSGAVAKALLEQEHGEPTVRKSLADLFEPKTAFAF